ncbi:putative zinc finger RNA-binding protein [Iris pallida]|uniref:Zinc finger RNA-binding protein n=1 Tax=Iris pallida TaxID=29817 RepID=A0AAX6FGQ6_IRIPA|nr:putative zinc finger RNA-binding protein [Iris pallida]
MGYGSEWPEPQPEYSDPLHHHQHQYSAPPSLHHHHRSYFHHPPNPNPNPNPLPTCDPPAPSVPPPADPYAPRMDYAYPHPQVGPTPPSYHYGGAASGAGGGVEPHGFSVKDAIRQYGVDPASYAGPPAPGYAPVTGYADPPMVGYADAAVGYAQAPPIPSHGLVTLVQAPPPKPNWKSQSYLGGAKKDWRKTTKVVQSAYCEVCKVDCSSQEVLNGHKQGKKHKKNLQKLQESITPKPLKAPAAVKPVGAKESQVASNGKAAVTGEKRRRTEAPAATEEDLETKKKKILEGGAAPDGVRVCTICNVVVNSQKVYDSHIAGQKHITMVKQQQQQEKSSS